MAEWIQGVKGAQKELNLVEEDPEKVPKLEKGMEMLLGKLAEIMQQCDEYD